MLQNVCQKWGGSHERMFEFADKASASAPEGHGLHAIVPMAHVERWLYCMHWQSDKAAANGYFRKRDVEKQIRGAWSRGLGSRSFRPVQTTPVDRNVFAFCFWRMGDYEAARKEFEALGPFAAELPWGYAGGPLRSFHRARRECAGSE